jgi:transglutaminase-like putative cysteine protease
MSSNQSFPSSVDCPRMETSMPSVRQFPHETIPLRDAIGRYFEVALYLLAFTGFGTLASTGGLDVPTTLLVCSALLFRGYLLAKRETLQVSERWTTILTIAYVGFYLIDYFYLSGGFLTATVHLVLFVMVVRMFSAQRDRDHYFIAIIAFLMVLAAAVLTVDSIFLAAFAGFLLVAVVTVILMEMNHAARKASIQSKETSDARAYRHMAMSLASASPVIVLFILMGAAAIFFVLPRFSAGYLSAYAPSNELTTGFSDRVQLGSIGTIQQSSAVVMHIKIDGDRTGAYDLKWRGVSLSEFDGRTWSTPHLRDRITPQSNGEFHLNTRLSRAAPSPREQTIHYQVLLEPFGSNVFFLAPTALTLRGNYRAIAIDSGTAVFNLDLEHSVERYEATSLITRDDAPRVLSERVSPEMLAPDLRLPAMLDPRIPLLAEQVSASATDNYNKALAVENYLKTKFGYTLQLPRVPPHDPLANFLFERRQGHCEYFASAMAVMLRSLGIPSRVVNGFRSGEFNDVSSQYVVRASNAHSWVEAYFPDRGWISFDPTPAATSELRTGWGRIMLYLDAAASFWREWIVSYDVGHQRLLGQQARRSSRQILADLQHWARQKYASVMTQVRHISRTLSKQSGRWTLGGILAVILLTLLANSLRLWRALRTWRLAKQPSRSPSMAATIWYERMLRVAAKRGCHKSPAQTPSEFVISIEDPLMRTSVARFTRGYERARFGDSLEDANCLADLYDEVSSATRC